DEYNYNIDLKSSVDGATYLIDACKCGDYEIVEFLIENGANIYLKDFKGKSAMNYASENAYYDIISLLSGEVF
ncbi:ankyrin repeat domain-containing protein, partial [Arthrospira platensis SPKY1]|nr:ankyrin repeat domain-containing protein [Arthrospira platensis SPKY1]